MVERAIDVPAGLAEGRFRRIDWLIVSIVYPLFFGGRIACEE